MIAVTASGKMIESGKSVGKAALEFFDPLVKLGSLAMAFCFSGVKPDLPAPLIA